MNKKTFLLPILFLAVIAIALSSPTAASAWLQTYETLQGSYGFFSGIWHGILAPFAVIAQIFDNKIILYAANNSGFGYNLGFLIGISMIIGGGASKTCR
ncbi:MAG: hypothetical protein ACOZAN_00040 [Patescibacteria group bacterium]